MTRDISVANKEQRVISDEVKAGGRTRRASPVSAAGVVMGSSIST